MLEPEASNELLLAVSRGDRDAFARLFKHFAPRIVGILMRDGMPFARAEDIAQEAMLSVWNKSVTFDPARGSAPNWIYSIARHASVDRHRRDGVLQLTPLDTEVNDPADEGLLPLDHIVDDMERAVLVRKALQQLKSSQIDMLQMAFFSDRSHSEIAHDLQLPLGTVKSHIRRALLTLKRMLGPLEP